MTRRQIDPAIRYEAVVRYAAGEPSAAVAEALDISPDSVLRFARKAGLPVRPQGGVGDPDIPFAGRWVRQGLIWRGVAS